MHHLPCRTITNPAPRPLPLMLAVGVGLLLPLVAAAENLVVRLDPAATEVTFLLPATGHDVHGLLQVTRGELVVDRVTGAATGEIVVDATEATTDNERRDRKMHEKVLESVRFPTMRFVADHVEGEIALDGESRFDVVGTMILRGDEHPFTLPVEAEVADGRFRARTQFTVPYVEWGLHNPSVLILRVAPEVDVAVDSHGEIREQPDSGEQEEHGENGDSRR